MGLILAEDILQTGFARIQSEIDAAFDEFLPVPDDSRKSRKTQE